MTNPDPIAVMVANAKARKLGITPEQQQRRREVDQRNEAIQATPLKAKDGVTFAKAHKDKR